MSLFQGPVKRPPLRNTYGSRRPTKQQRQPDGSTSSTHVASVTAGATDPESLNPSRDRSAAAASASSVGNAAAATAKRPVARHEHGTPTSASVRTASGRQTPETSTRDDNDAAPPPSSRKRKQTPEAPGRAHVKPRKRVIEQDRASTSGSSSSSSSEDEIYIPLGSGKKSNAPGSSSSPLPAAPRKGPQRPTLARAEGSRSSPRLRPGAEQHEMDATSRHTGGVSASPSGQQSRTRIPKKRRIDMMDQDEGADEGLEDADSVADSSLAMLHTAESSAPSLPTPHPSIALPRPAAAGCIPASSSGHSVGDAARSARTWIQSQNDVPSARMASASTTELGLAAQEASVPATQPYAAVNAVVRKIEHTSPSAQDSATHTQRATLASTDKGPEAPVVDPASSASQKNPSPRADHSIDFDFDFGDLLDVPTSSTLQVFPFPSVAVPKRGSLVRHMSARSEAGSDAGTPSIFPSPAGTPNKRARADSAGYFGSPARSGGSVPGSPLRGLQATSSAPELLGAAIAPDASLLGSRAGTPFLQTGEAAGPVGASPAYAPRPPPASPPPGRAKRTYGQSRSILPETDLAAPLAPMAIFAPAVAESSRPSFFQRNSSAFGDLHVRTERSRAASSVGEEGGSGDEDDDDEEDLTESQAQLHSINQLRSAGESKRFADEIHYLLDGFGDSAVSVHRASAIEILRKLSDESWMKKLQAFGYVEQVYDSFRAGKAGDGDRILDTCLVALVARLVQYAQCGELLLVYPAGFDCLKALGRVAAQPWAKERLLPGTSRLGKTEKRLLGSINGIAESWWQAANHKTSARSMVIDTLAIMLEGQLPEGHSPASILAGTALFEQTLEALPASLPGSPIAEIQTGDARNVHSCARVILAVLESPGSSSQEQLLASHASRMAPGLVNVLTSCRGLLERSRTTDLALMEMVASTMKLLAILMETLDAWHKAITKPLRADVIPALFAYTEATEKVEMPAATAASPAATSTPSSTAMQQERSQGSTSTVDAAAAVAMARLDILCLSLTLLQTLLEGSSEARKALRKDDSDPTGESPLIRTSLLYARFQKDAATQPEKELLAKYCSLLVVYGMLGDRASQTAVVAALREAPSEGALAALTITLEELQALHAQGSENGVDTHSVSGTDLDEAAELFRASI